MQTLATKFVAAASIAALLAVTPVSVGFVSPSAGQGGFARVTLNVDSAQAHEARGGRGAGGHGAVGGRGRASHEMGQRTAARGFNGGDIRANNVRADNVRANDVRANNVRANNVQANNVRANNINANDVRLNRVNVNDVNANYVRAPYVRPPYVQPWAAAAAVGTAVAVGTTVAVLPASCSVVEVNGVTYHHCGDAYYVAADGAYVAVNAPR
jgi:hypothetical protein